MSIDYQGILEKIQQEVQPLIGQGKVATYIPELAKVSPASFRHGGLLFGWSALAVGDAFQKFSTQSVTKLFALALAFEREGDAI